MADERENRAKNDFVTQAAKPQAGLATEFWEFLRDNKKWWLLPILIVLLLLSLLLVLSSTAVAPFIYTIF